MRHISSIRREFIEVVIEGYGCQPDPGQNEDADGARIWWLLKGDEVGGAVALPPDVPRRLLFEISRKADIPVAELFNADQAMTEDASVSQSPGLASSD